MGNNAKLEMESIAVLGAYEAWTHQGDNLTWIPATNLIASSMAGYETVLRPTGIVQGYNVGSTHASNNTATVAGCKVNVLGVEETVAAGSQALTRPLTDVAKICSVTVGAGGVLAEAEGVSSLTTAFNPTGARGSAGAMPLIPIDEAELFQVWMTTTASAVFTDSEIRQAPGYNSEYANIPNYSFNPIGLGQTGGVRQTAHAAFESAMPLSHTGLIPKPIWGLSAAVTFVELSKAVDLTLPTNTPSSTSAEYFNRTTSADTSLALGGGTFTIKLADGITDTISRLDNQTLTFRFYPDRNKVPYWLFQGTIGVAPSYGISKNPDATVTIASEFKAVGFNS